MGSSNDHHIVMLPFMAQGHIIPFLSLATEIQQKTGFTITIVNTPLNIQYLRSTTAAQPCIRLVELPFCSSDHGLPPDAENTENLTLSQRINFLHASTTLRSPVLQFLNDIVQKEGRPPICLISDVFFGWALDVANAVGTKNFTFTTCGAYGTAAYVSLWQNLPHKAAESDEFLVPGFPTSSRFHVNQLHQFMRTATGRDEWCLFFQPQLSLALKSHGWLCNTVEEIEPLGLDIMRKYLKLNVWSIGPLLPQAMLTHSSSRNIFGHRITKAFGVLPEKCIEWLNSYPQNSVLYISFGSQNTISTAQMMEFAMGLEESGKPFIWAIRPPLGFDIKGEFRNEWLPEGFEQRITESKRGILVHKWAPQLEILSHKSVGAFLSHCGWNSILESLSQGVPIIGWPLAAEQPYNSKMLMEEMGVAVELARGLQAVVIAKEVKTVIETAMDKEGRGGEMRKKAVVIREKIRAAVREERGVKGSSVKAMDDFIETILSKRKPEGDQASS